MLFSTVAETIYIPTNNAEKDSFFSKFMSPLVISYLLDNRYSNRCEVISHCGFNLHFLMTSWAPFHGPVGHLLSSLKNVCLDLLSIFLIGFFFPLNSMSSLYTLDIDFFSDMICKYFLSLPSRFLDDFLCCTEGFQFYVIPLVYFCFFPLCFCCQIQKHHCQNRCQGAYSL